MKLLLAIVWLLVGGAISAAVYWGFLIMPVSTVLALITSAILGLVTLVLVGMTVSGTFDILTSGVSVSGFKRAWRSVPAIVPAALIVLLVWWMTSRAELWVGQRSGPISAWFIARFGWDDISWLFTAIRYVAAWFRWVIALMFALSLIAGVHAIGWRALAQPAWVRRALAPRSLLVATICFVVLIALPWMYLVPWRPTSLPATGIELAFITTKLATAAVLFAAGIVLIAREASRSTHDPAV